MNPRPDADQARRLVAAAPCHVVLPAGCGKTQVVASVAATVAADCQRVLVLTHTRAGIDTLRTRLREFAVPSQAIGLTTIASWTRRLVEAYPKAAGCQVDNSGWAEVCAGARRALSNPHIAAMVAGSYDLVVVDEYQDCTRSQHGVVLALNAIRPVVAFGDPLQAIYSFGEEQLVDFGAMEPLRAVSLPCVGWRWRGKNDRLGAYLLDVREALLAGAPIDLRAAGVGWVEATSENSRKALWRTVSAVGNVAVLARFDAQCERIAKGLSGRFDVMEDVEGTRLLGAAAAVDDADGARAAGAVLALAKASMAKLPATLTNKIKPLQDGRVPGFRPGTPVSAALGRLQQFADGPSPPTLLSVLDELDRLGVVCRKEAWRDFRRSVRVWEQGTASLSDAVRKVRNRNRILGRRGALRSVSRAVLVKGQEFDHCLVTTPENMTSEELYVCMTRGTKSLTVIAPEPVLRPASGLGARGGEAPDSR